MATTLKSSSAPHLNKIGLSEGQKHKKKTFDHIDGATLATLRQLNQKRTSKKLAGDSAKPHSIDSQSKPHSASSRSSSQITTIVENGGSQDTEGEQDVRFINVPSKPHSAWGDKPSDKVEGEIKKVLKEISPDQVLNIAQESDPLQVYEVFLHGCNLGKIERLEQFRKIRVLDLSSNQISVIENLKKNSEIRELKLYDNKVTTIKNIDHLSELQNLQLQHNLIHNIGSGLQSLRKLRNIRLDHNQISKIDIKEITSCAMLTSLDLSGNRLESISALSCLPNIEELYAGNNRLRTLSDLSRCKKLAQVDLSNNKLTEVSGLKGLPGLKILHLDFNQMASMKSLGKAKQLEELRLSHNSIGELVHITTLFPALQILDVSENKINTWDQACQLSKMRDLVELFMAGNPFASEGGDKPNYHSALPQKIPTLEILDGASVKKSTQAQPATPLMRPMSAATVVTARQVENQLRSQDQEVQNLEMDIAARFESMRACLHKLPTKIPTGQSIPDTLADSPTVPGTARPMTKCGKRSRIAEARQYAALHFDEEVHKTEG